MWIVRLALRRPLHVHRHGGLMILLLGGFAIATTPTDIFPGIDIPVVSVIWNYGGLATEEMAARITSKQSDKDWIPERRDQSDRLISPQT
jgi:multidrug efflux pump subunit AcrB